jgi:SNF2 family DNA or RNA helicase
VIVAPPSLLEYWETEFNKWKPIEITVPIIKINSKKEGFILDRISFSKNQSRIFILTSNAFHDLKDDLHFLIYCDLMIIDEGHKAKNVDTNLRRSIKNFHSNRQKIILTGTPV